MVEMIFSVKDLSPDQKLTIESLLGHSVSEEEQIVIRTVSVPAAPDWLRSTRTVEEIDAEITAARRDRSERAQRPR